MIVIVADINGGIRRRFEWIDQTSELQRNALIDWLLDVLPSDQQMTSTYVRMWKEDWSDFTKKPV